MSLLKLLLTITILRSFYCPAVRIRSCPPFILLYTTHNIHSFNKVLFTILSSIWYDISIPALFHATWLWFTISIQLVFSMGFRGARLGVQSIQKTFSIGLFLQPQLICIIIQIGRITFVPINQLIIQIIYMIFVSVHWLRFRKNIIPI